MLLAAVALLAEGVDRNRIFWNPAALAVWSPSSRRAWIEISMLGSGSEFPCVALLAEGVDRNQITVDFRLLVDGSPSSRRAWIEI